MATTAGSERVVGAFARRWTIVHEALLFVGLVVVYEAVRTLVAVPSTAQAPFSHAHDVISLERRLGLFVEPRLQHVVHRAPPLSFFTTWFYTVAYTAGFIGFFLWLWLRHRRRFVFVRTWFWLTNGLALVAYWVYPLAPPRLVPELGLTDPTKRALELRGGLSWFQHLRNLYAAMPSMHVGHTVLFALAITLLLRTRWRLVAWVWPAVMLFTVMATANHYWLDGVGGAAAVGLALVLALVLVRRGMRPWDSRPASA